MMKSRKLYIVLSVLLPLVGLWGCKDGFTDERLPLDGDVPVEFVFDGPAGLARTRGVEDYKKLFAVGDVIHVQASFTSNDGAQSTAYGAMRLSEARKWVAIEGAELYWPFDAATGTFKAWYVYGSDGPLYPGTATATVSLSDINDTQDPLEAVKENVKYGNAVNMQFTHACTHLTLEKLDLNVTDYYWMVLGGGESIKNAFRLALDAKNELKLEFLSVGDRDYKDVAYISRRSETMTAQDADGNNRTYSKTSFYLAPGIYDSFELRTNNNFPYMSFINSIPGDEETGRKPGELLANHPYILNVEFAKGADYVTNTEDDWDETDAVFQVDVKAFLEAVRYGREYTGKAENGEDVPVLRSVNGALVLLRNLDFQFYDKYAFEELGFYPDVSAGTILEGNLHYIENIGHPVFRFNSGTIRNLGLKTLKSTVTAFETDAGNQDRDFSNIGGLCLRNEKGAIIRNIRMEDFDLTVKIQAEDPRTGKQSNDNFSIGGLCGDNLSTISEISLKGEIKIVVKPLGETAADDYHYVDANINIGGIAGNHTMILSDVAPETGKTFSVTITNICRGRDDWGSGVFCLGGAVGQSTANEISRVVMRNVTINAKESDGYQQYIGGLAGRLRGNATAEITSFMSDCTVDGKVTCGTVSQFGDNAISPYCYVGGLSGNARDYNIHNCRAVCDVDAMTTPSKGTTFATGGAIGLIQSGVTLSDNSAYGSLLQGLQGGSDMTAHVGNFAGIARTTYSWDEADGKVSFKAAGNTARNFGYPMIGEFLESGSGSDD